MSDCNHQWQQEYEEFLLGGAFPVGFRCKVCNLFVSKSEIGPEGLSGTNTGEKVLFGPHGCKSTTASGKPYSKQISYPDGRLEIIE